MMATSTMARTAMGDGDDGSGEGGGAGVGGREGQLNQGIYSILWKCSVTYASDKCSREWANKNSPFHEWNDVEICVNVRNIWRGRGGPTAPRHAEMNRGRGYMECACDWKSVHFGISREFVILAKKKERNMYSAHTENSGAQAKAKIVSANRERREWERQWRTLLSMALH